MPFLLPTNKTTIISKFLLTSATTGIILSYQYLWTQGIDNTICCVIWLSVKEKKSIFAPRTRYATMMPMARGQDILPTILACWTFGGGWAYIATERKKPTECIWLWIYNNNNTIWHIISYCLRSIPCKFECFHFQYRCTRFAFFIRNYDVILRTVRKIIVTEIWKIFVHILFNKLL